METDKDGKSRQTPTQRKKTEIEIENDIEKETKEATQKAMEKDRERERGWSKGERERERESQGKREKAMRELTIPVTKSLHFNFAANSLTFHQCWLFCSSGSVISTGYSMKYLLSRYK